MGTGEPHCSIDAFLSPEDRFVLNPQLLLSPASEREGITLCHVTCVCENLVSPDSGSSESLIQDAVNLSAQRTYFTQSF
jgi:hypothetical protein